MLASSADRGPADIGEIAKMVEAETGAEEADPCAAERQI